MTRRNLTVFTKPAVPGRVKTRLVSRSVGADNGNLLAPPEGPQDLSSEHAASLHEAFLGDLADELSKGDFELRLAWALEAGEPVPGFRRSDGTPVPAGRQVLGDLGARLQGALAEALETSPAAAVVGSDHPRLSYRRVEEAFELLEAAVEAAEAGPQVVFGPARDGGYYLVALGRDVAEEGFSALFRDIPWSTASVLEVSLQRCREVGLRVALLQEGTDVDTPEDLASLAGELLGAPEACPRTRRLMASWGWWTEGASG